MKPHRAAITACACATRRQKKVSNSAGRKIRVRYAKTEIAASDASTRIHAYVHVMLISCLDAAGIISSCYPRSVYHNSSSNVLFSSVVSGNIPHFAVRSLVRSWMSKFGRGQINDGSYSKVERSERAGAAIDRGKNQNTKASKM